MIVPHDYFNNYYHGNRKESKPLVFQDKKMLKFLKLNFKKFQLRPFNCDIIQFLKSQNLND